MRKIAIFFFLIHNSKKSSRKLVKNIAIQTIILHNKIQNKNTQSKSTPFLIKRRQNL